MQRLNALSLAQWGAISSIVAAIVGVLAFTGLPGGGEQDKIDDYFRSGYQRCLDYVGPGGNEDLCELVWPLDDSGQERRLTGEGYFDCRRQDRSAEDCLAEVNAAQPGHPSQ